MSGFDDYMDMMERIWDENAEEYMRACEEEKKKRKEHGTDKR